jgi:hypothetical protein
VPLTGLTQAALLLRLSRNGGDAERILARTNEGARRAHHRLDQ